MSEREFCQLLENARSGSQTAISELVAKFTPTIFRAIRRAMVRSSRRSVDSEDIAQSVWRTFFSERQNLTIDTSAQLHALLKRIATYKTIDLGRRHIVRQRYLGNLAQGRRTTDLSAIPEGQNASPLKELIAKESLEQLIATVPPRFAEVIQKRAEGATLSEISVELGIPLRSLHRILKNAREKVNNDK